MKKAIFLDRDGVINIDTGYVSKIEDFKFIDGIFESCTEFIKNGFDIFVITNQSGIGRGYFSENDFLILTNWMKKEFEKHSINIKKVYFCPHTPEDNCNCRKPKPQMLVDAKSEFNLDLDNSWFIGDKISDMKCALNVGMKNMILINSEYIDTKHDFEIVNNIIEAKEKILKGL